MEIVLGSSGLGCPAQNLASSWWEDRLENGREGGWEPSAASGGTGLVLVLGRMQSPGHLSRSSLCASLC